MHSRREEIFDFDVLNSRFVSWGPYSCESRIRLFHAMHLYGIDKLSMGQHLGNRNDGVAVLEYILLTQQLHRRLEIVRRIGVVEVDHVAAGAPVQCHLIEHNWIVRKRIDRYVR